MRLQSDGSTSVAVYMCMLVFDVYMCIYVYMRMQSDGSASVDTPP